MKHILLFVFMIISGQGFTQTVIRGKVLDDQGSPIPMANVYLENTYDGTTTDIEGVFSFSTDEVGQQVLVAKFLGYREHRSPINLTSKTLDVTLTLAEEINQLKAVTISAGSFAASDESRRTIFRALDIATTAGATADIAGALNTLPGTQKVGESGRLFVRGGDGEEVKTYIDGMLVFDAYSPAAPNTPSRGRFLPFMFKGTSFSTGGYTAEFGQALSSALVLDSKDESSIDRTDIGILSVGGDVAHTQSWTNGSIAGKLQYTNLRPYTNLVKQDIEWDNAPVSYEGVVAFRQRFGKTGMMKVYGNFNESRFSLYRHDIDNSALKNYYDLTNKYRYFNGVFRDRLNDRWSVRGGLAYSSIINDISLDDQNINEAERGVHGKLVIEGSFADINEVRTGFDVYNRNYDYEIDGASTINQSFSENIFAWFVETDLYANNNFVARIGKRTEWNSLSKQFTIDPRVSIAYKTGDQGQVSFAFGNFHQTARNQYVRENKSLHQERATHYILNYQRIQDNKTFRVEAYYKEYDKLIKFGSQGINNEGSGYARGVELFWRDHSSVKNLDYWLSYSFLDTERDYLNYPVASTPSFASQHNFSAVGKYFVSKIKSQLGATFSVSSGRPYNDKNSIHFNDGRTPSYQDLSFNWSYLPKPYVIVYFSCTNLLGRDNIFGYEYGNTPNESGVYNSRAIRQPAPRFLFLGIFITLSKDKSVNQLPTL